MFADLFAEDGRRSVPPMIVAVVMVLQRLEGLSDREAVDRFAFDVRWKYAAGGLDFDHPGFVHTVLVDMRARLAASDRPDRIFERTVEVAAQAGLIGRKRVLDSAPIYDAVATQDTVTLIRSAIRNLLRAAERDLRVELRAVISSGDAYTDTGKPVIDWTDVAEREALIDSRARDGYALLAQLEERRLSAEVEQAGRLLATVLGQDLDQGEDGVFRIARKVAKDRVISTVDPEARHGRKTVSRSFDGYKGHVRHEVAQHEWVIERKVGGCRI
ncbi:transposase [Nonomuraea turkmeniaca]|uniref:Transposase n=1 Tax=Nonomuraea turkmeniaca TaxID=103838 RepID=A0A5S4EV46_9ACTN|nr:transposase [Nonomuraea turkmeniaca]TMR05496.1 transposase [Nonomuraea turkmeniaca]